MNKSQQFNSLSSHNYLPNQLKYKNLVSQYNNPIQNSNVSYYYSGAPIQKLKEVQQIKKEVNFKNEIEYFDNKLIIEKQNMILDKINNLEQEMISLHLKIDNFKRKKKDKYILNEELELINKDSL